MSKNPPSFQSYSPGIQSLLPLFYVAWADQVLSPNEVRFLEKKIAGSQKNPEISDLEAKNRVAERKLSLLSNREIRDLRRHAFIDICMQ